ncbi:MAG TPA: ATP-binding cassette domain-containing protein [Burkholderiales bacterium]|nr:ATP-binding cassette domain-containing protein [Burkholderiales bacterium]
MLRISHLDVAIESVGVLRDVSLEVPTGRFVGLIGRNGAGKTTLIRSVMGLLAPRSGSIEYDGRPLERIPTHIRARSGIGYMPEDRRLVPDLSVEDNILIPAWSSRIDDPDTRLLEIYRMIPEVEQFAQRKALLLSGGQQKLVALARALMCGSRLLLLDEPFEGVAPVLARRLAEVISGLKQKGLSMILAESDLSHSGEILDQVYTIDRGEVALAC